MKLALALALTTCATALELQSLTQFLKQTDTAAGLTAVTAARSPAAQLRAWRAAHLQKSDCSRRPT